MDCLEADCYLQSLSYILVGNRNGIRIQGLLIRGLNDILQGVVLAAAQRAQVCVFVCVCVMCMYVCVCVRYVCVCVCVRYACLQAMYFVGPLLKF